MTYPKKKYLDITKMSQDKYEQNVGANQMHDDFTVYLQGIFGEDKAKSFEDKFEALWLKAIHKKSANFDKCKFVKLLFEALREMVGL